MLEPVDFAIRLTTAGRFAEALHTIETASLRQEKRTVADVLMIQLLERTGRHDASRALTERLLRSKALTKRHRSVCELVLGRIDWERNGTEAAIAHLQRAVALAIDANDPEQTCWAQLWLWAFLSERSGVDAASATFSTLRANAAAHPEVQLLAALHIFVAISEGKRGCLRSAERHNRIGRELVQSAPNKWLEGVSENNALAFSVLRSDFDGGLRHAQRAIELAEESGVAVLKRASLGNLGNLYYFMGKFSDAAECLNRARSVISWCGPNGAGVIDALANICLTNDQPAECASLLGELDELIGTPKHRELYVYRYSELTRTRLLAHQGNLREAKINAERLLGVAREMGDMALSLRTQLTLTDLAQRMGKTRETEKILDTLAFAFDGQPPDLYAQYEQTIGCALARAQEASAKHHLERSRRIYETVGAVPGIIALERQLRTVEVAFRDEDDETEVKGFRAGQAAAVLNSVAAVVLFAGRPELVAAEVASILRATGLVDEASPTRQDPKALASVPVPAADGSASSTVCLPIGSTETTVFAVRVTFRPNIETIATINAVKLLLRTIQDLEQARLDREERAALWPVDELPLDNGQAVAVGEMRKLLDLARRVASTNVSVLITGESGTGKEILARAVHAFSARADKPFVPLNCTAIPRDILESQMFGHRRGAFTGADRDNLGVVRAAREGTLFLDEIGEMGLDLQPKILRFLESGEISPLGEPEPITVDVRIIAATNADLEQLVRDGRFREDLFYRLNVFRLSIPPLRRRRDEIPAFVNEFVRRAGLEFNKGHVRITEETMDHLLVYSWPGNIRQLQNEVRRMVALAEPNAILKPADIAADIRASLPLFHASADGRQIVVSLDEPLVPTLTRIETDMITLALRDHGGKVDAAARALGISRKGLYLKRQRLGL